MKNILVASGNRGKVDELAAILGGLPAQLVLPQDIGLQLVVEETGQTFAENALLKASEFARASGLLTLADDSGLEVEALAGGPGVYSARYAGEGATDAQRRAKLIDAVRQASPPRRACFRCVIAVQPSSGHALTFEGECRGEIILEERGSHGFGYDPIFYLPEYAATMAELAPDLKNQISHRGSAARAALPHLAALLQE